MVNRSVLLVSLLCLAFLGGCPAPGPTDALPSKEATNDLKNEAIKINDEDGTASMGGDTEVTETELGLPYYPGSTPKKGGAFKVEAPSERNYCSIRLTGDDADKVIAFYKSKVKSGVATPMSGADTSGSLMTGSIGEDGKVAISAMRKKGETSTEITINVGYKVKK